MRLACASCLFLLLAGRAAFAQQPAIHAPEPFRAETEAVEIDTPHPP